MKLTRRGERVAAALLFTPVFASALFMPSNAHAATKISPAHKHKIIVQALACEHGTGSCHRQYARINLVYRWTHNLHQVKGICKDFIYLMPNHSGDYTWDEIRAAWKLGFCDGEVDLTNADSTRAGDMGTIVRLELALGIDETRS